LPLLSPYLLYPKLSLMKIDRFTGTLPLSREAQSFRNPCLVLQLFFLHLNLSSLGFHFRTSSLSSHIPRSSFPFELFFSPSLDHSLCSYGLYWISFKLLLLGSFPRYLRHLLFLYPIYYLLSPEDHSPGCHVNALHLFRRSSFFGSIKTSHVLLLSFLLI